MREVSNPIFVTDDSVDDDNHSEVIDWCYANLNHKNVFIISSSDLYYLIYESQILDIINDENNSMLGEAEDDWIIENEIKLRIKTRLSDYVNLVTNKRELEMLESILRLIDVSIEMKRNLYFHFT